MNNKPILYPSTRREFLLNGARGIGLLTFSQFAPSFLTHTTLAGSPGPEKDRTVLVLIQLAGGNDGLNTLVPFQDSNYFRLRPRLALKSEELIPVGENMALNPALKEIANLHRDGKVAIIQNVGYPNPNRSHFRSSEIWETASESDQFLSTGWLGRYFDNRCSGQPSSDHPLAIHVSNQLPQTLQSSKPHNIFGITRRLGRRGSGKSTDLLEKIAGAQAEGENLNFLQHTLMDAIVTEKRIRRITEGYLPLVDYPQSRLSAALRGVAAMISGGLETRVFFVSQGGYDTHANQANIHRRLLQELSSAMAAFQKDLEAHHLQDQVLTMTFSEFGRRPSENTSGGTDHGTAAPLFVMGSRIKETVIGTAPSLDLDRNQDLRFSTDFRRIYSTVLKKWLQCDSHPILNQEYSPLNFV